MDDTDFDERLALLKGALSETVELLTRHGELHWRAWAERCLRGLDGFDAAAFDQVLSVFGGMGSFNDLLVLEANGHTITKVEEAAVNDRLWSLRGQIWHTATELRHETSELTDS